jgi:hypothetical protein
VEKQIYNKSPYKNILFCFFVKFFYKNILLQLICGIVDLRVLHTVKKIISAVNMVFDGLNYIITIKLVENVFEYYDFRLNNWK